MPRIRRRNIFAIASVVAVVASTLVGANVVSADSVWVQSYERTSQTQACAAQPGETPWQASWGTDSSWSPSWEQWANKGIGGWVCTRSITWARSTPSARTYALGDIGPGGGLVFLISGGLTYEMASKNWNDPTNVSAIDPTDDWCSDTSNFLTTEQTVGTGSANTTAMLTDASPFVACTSSAPNAVRSYNGGGYSDWFLPSLGELAEMYDYSLVVGFDQATYGFGTGNYWSSSDATGVTAFYVAFVDGSQFDGAKNGALRVRPVRAF